MNNGVINYLRFSRPETLYPLTGRLIPIFEALTIALGLLGFGISFFSTIVDGVCRQAYRIIFTQVQASWISIFVYVVMASWVTEGLVLDQDF